MIKKIVSMCLVCTLSTVYCSETSTSSMDSNTSHFSMQSQQLLSQSAQLFQLSLACNQQASVSLQHSLESLTREKQNFDVNKTHLKAQIADIALLAQSLKDAAVDLRSQSTILRASIEQLRQTKCKSTKKCTEPTQ